MASFLRIAVLLLAAFGVCLSQRRVNRNESPGTEAKTVINFNCPEEFGYYPHPSDCTQYYVCVFGGALLESCTGGLMYSHELQTCDWPRNVGCDITEISGAVSITASNPPSKIREEPKPRYIVSTPPAPQPSAIVTSRGQARQLHRSQQDNIKQRQQSQLYDDAEEALSPAEEIESDRQQRVYRGQPSTVGQVQKDRDGLRNSNEISAYNGRSDRISVISFGSAQSQPLQKYSRQFDDLLTNDLTMKRRRKRQTRTRIRFFETWHGGQNNRKTPGLTISPQIKTSAYSPAFTQLSDDDFKPFLPNYYKTPIYTTAKVEPYKALLTPPTNNHYYTRITTFRPQIRHKLKPDSHMVPQNTHLINTTFLGQVTIPNIQNSTTLDNDQPAEQRTRDNSNIKEDYFESNENFGPPLSYFNTKNKYENIENPFANPEFDFDKFISNLRVTVLTIDSKKEVTTEKTGEDKLKSINKNQEKEYYYNEDDAEKSRDDDLDQKKKYSSKIKPLETEPTKTPEEDDYYYEIEDAHPNKYYLKNANLTKNSESKYSSKYHEKPLKSIKTGYVPHSEIYISSTTVRSKNNNILPRKTFSSYDTITTTEKPNHTTDYKIILTGPTTITVKNKKRQRLTNDDLTLRIEQTSTTPVQLPISIATATARALYNSSQYNNNNLNKDHNNNYDNSYYTLYDDDVEVYRDVDYPQQYNNNNNNNAEQSQSAQQQSYRRTPSPIIQTTQDESSKRGSTGYIHKNFNSQDIYQHPAGPAYNEYNYNTQVEDQNSYRQTNRPPARKDRNDLNYFEETTTKRITTTTTTRKTPTRTTSRAYLPKKSTVSSKLPITANENSTQATFIIDSLQEDPRPYTLTHHTIIPQNDSSIKLDATFTLNSKLSDTNSETITEAHVFKPTSLTLSRHLTTKKPVVYHYITKASRSTTLVSTESLQKKSTSKKSYTNVVVPTTYSPPFFYLKSLLPIVSSTAATKIDTKSEFVPSKSFKSFSQEISPVNVNYELSGASDTNFESAEKLAIDIDDNKSLLTHPSMSGSNTHLNRQNNKLTDFQSSTAENIPASFRSIPQIVHKLKNNTDNSYADDILNFVNETNLKQKNNSYITKYNVSSELTNFRTSIEVPPSMHLINKDIDQQTTELDESLDYEIFTKSIRPLTTTMTMTRTTTSTRTPITTKAVKLLSHSSIPVRISRVNTVIKSQIANGGPQRQKVKCYENSDAICNEPKYQRTGTRNRGSTHYTNGANVINNEVTVTINRGTPASRPRPTLKPSTSIVSKASEFIDIYRFPPTRPEPIYPQPQPDKTAAKCRKDVCLLPDCYCGGKEIPGDLQPEQVPQIVLLTFDDSVNDLNKGLYSDLFEKGRVNPNGCPIAATFYVSHEWTDYSQVQNLYSDGHEIASHTVSHSFGEQFSQKKWTREVAGQREILSAYGGVRLEDVRGMRAPFLSVGGNKMFKMLYDSNFTYDSSMPIYENKPPSWPYTLDYKLFHDCMIPPCPTRSYPGVWEVPMVMWQDLNGGRCSMGDACSNPPDAEGVFKMLTKNFQRHYTTNRAPFGLFYHAAWFTQPHHKEGFINFLDSILQMKDVWLVTNWQAIQWVRDPTPVSRLNSFQPFQCDYSNRPKRCNNPKVCNLWHKSGVRYMRTCQPCPDIYPWTGNTGIRSSRIDNNIED